MNKPIGMRPLGTEEGDNREIIIAKNNKKKDFKEDFGIRFF
jgi:hypothetical protein